MRKTMKTAAVLAAMSVMVLGATVAVSAAEQGWEKKGSAWYYNDSDGDPYINKWAQDGDKWYFLGGDGKMVTNSFIDAWEHVVTNYDTITNVTYADRSHSSGYDTFYYVDENGAMVTGWKKITNVSQSRPTNYDSSPWYYFAADGVMYGSEWVFSEGEWYYLGDNGQLRTNCLQDGYFLGNREGAMETGWVWVTNSTAKTNLGIADSEDSWVYCGTDGKPVANSWKKINGAWYCFGDSIAAEGWTIYASDADAKDTAYWAAVSGAAVREVSDIGDRAMHAATFIKDGSSSGVSTLVTNYGTSTPQDNVFYLTASGSMATGWFKPYRDTSKRQYYADSSGRVYYNRFEKIGGKYYLFNDEGCVTGSGYYLSDGTNLSSFGVNSTSTAAAYSKANNVAVYQLGTGNSWFIDQYYTN